MSAVDRIQTILSRFPKARVLVLGDFFLDRYYVLDASLTEHSIETGLDAYQVVGRRLSPGAAGTVVSNLVALDAGVVAALGVIGLDGEGYELLSCLDALNVRTDWLMQLPARATPTYTKPMMLRNGSETELNRLDIKNRSALDPDLEARVISVLEDAVPQFDAVVVGDQVPERNCGVVTDGVRECLARLADEHPKVHFLADSRERIGEYRNVRVKPNRAEMCHALGLAEENAASIQEVLSSARRLSNRTGKPLYVTLGADGILSVDRIAYHVPTFRQTGPLDICGAGDSAMAGLTLALCSGASPEEAAVVGNVVASLTVQQIGVTGAASRDQVIERLESAGDQFQPILLQE